jgi:hypothetical protein
MDSLEFERKLKELELSIDRLRSLYEQYFRGMEKIPPSVLQKKVERDMRELRRERLRNTAHRFRLQTQVQKYTTYLTYWQRIIRMIENGQVKRGPSGIVPQAPARRRASLDIPEVPAKAAAPRSPAAPKTRRRPPPPRADAQKPSEKEDLLDIDIDIDFG